MKKSSAQRYTDVRRPAVLSQLTCWRPTVQDSCGQVVQLECKLTKIRHFLNLKFGRIVQVNTRCRRDELWRSQCRLANGDRYSCRKLFEVISRTNCAEETSRRKYIPTDQLRIVITNDRTIVLLQKLDRQIQQRIIYELCRNFKKL